MWSLIKSIHVRLQGVYKNKFELDRLDHDSHANRTERCLLDEVYTFNGL